MRKGIVILSLVFFAFFLNFILDAENIKAVDYNALCNDKIEANDGIYGKCGNNNIYLTDSVSKSSYFVSTLNLYDDAQILYAGKVGGLDTFYSMGFHYYGVIYDDRGLFTSDDNYWSDISLNGVLIYEGKINDSFLVEQSKTSPVRFYGEAGTYLIRQYKGKKLIKAVKVIVANERDYGIEIEKVQYGDKTVGLDYLVGKSDDVKFFISGGVYGYGDKIKISINECEFIKKFNVNLTIKNQEIRECLTYNEKNSMSLTVYNGFNKGKTFKYNFNLNSNNVSIKLESSINAIETSSRRLVVKAYAGSGKTLDEKYNLYYWSKNPNDNLTYESFMTNYELSENKGTYTDSRGVILRETVGVYYLYALAKDDDSTVVVRSDEYVLKEETRLTKIVLKDVVFVGGLIVLSALPIFAYLIVRGKDND